MGWQIAYCNFILNPNPMDELMKLTEKVCDYHNKIVELSNKWIEVDDAFASEVSHYLAHDVPRILLDADKHEAFMCISAMCKGLPHTFLVNVLTGLVLYIFAERAWINIDTQTDDDPDAPINTNILVTDRK